MSDWGLASGPTDLRSHAQMLMQAKIRSEKNPYETCDCGGEFHPEEPDENISIDALQMFVCDSCGERTYDWKAKHKDRQDDEYKW